MKRWAILLALALSVLLVQTAAANLVVNGDFGTGDLTGWTFTAASSGSDFNIDSESGPPPPGYTYAANFGAVGAFDDTITQTIATVAGQTYTFSFLLNHNSTNAENDFNVYWGADQILALLNDASFDWTAYSYTETATGASTTIEFAGRDVPAWYGLDGVDVEGASVVPLPGTLVLLGSGLLSLLGWRRMQQG